MIRHHRFYVPPDVKQVRLIVDDVSSEWLEIERDADGYVELMSESDGVSVRVEYNTTKKQITIVGDTL